MLLNATGCKHNGQCDGRGKLGAEECIGKGSNRLGGGWSNTPELASAKFSNCCKPHDPAVTPPTNRRARFNGSVGRQSLRGLILNGELAIAARISFK